MRRYFGVDASGVGWAHAVNSRAELSAALNDPTVHMLEADILMRSKDLGPSRRKSSRFVLQPIMCHPPAKDSDLTFDEFARTVIASLRDGRKVGLKLDFKQAECVAPCLDTLRARGFCQESQSSYSVNAGEFEDVPLWLNADVVRGPGGREPIDGPSFVSACVSTCPHATLSLGWTHTGTPLLGYTHAMALEMKKLVAPLRCDVTLAASAAHLFASANPARAVLIDDVVNGAGVGDARVGGSRDAPGRSFTLWGPAPGPVTRWIERELPPEATYVDVKACNWKEEAVVRLYVYTRPAWATLHDARLWLFSRRR